MTTYESACLLVHLLKAQKIDANITSGGVYVYYKRHQRKTMTDIFNSLGNLLDYVDLHVCLLCPRSDYYASRLVINMHVLRKQGNPISVSHKP